MRINVLGPIEIVSDARARPPGGPGQRALLAALALDHGRVVTVDRLTRILWADRPPATARTKIQAHVSALRQLMGHGPGDADSPLLTIPPGYLLADRAVDLDLAEFSGLMSRGLGAAEAGDPAAASELLADALALWRGTAFTGVGAIPILAAAEGLDARRLMAADAKAEADLELGRYATVVTELSALLIAHPLRERSCGLAMLALDRLGCRADALGLYRSGERALRRELGIEPGGWLRGVHDRILTSDAGTGAGADDLHPRPFRWMIDGPGAGGAPTMTNGVTAIRAEAHRATRNP
ncbi:MAG: AfsR/SARP family transcriptional regulator [Streptosporangiaceae bacterium]|jgi:DNA-binding SARP family transcriptional activator